MLYSNSVILLYKTLFFLFLFRAIFKIVTKKLLANVFLLIKSYADSILTFIYFVYPGHLFTADKVSDCRKRKHSFGFILRSI